MLIPNYTLCVLVKRQKHYLKKEREREKSITRIYSVVQFNCGKNVCDVLFDSMNAEN